MVLQDIDDGDGVDERTGYILLASSSIWRHIMWIWSSVTESGPELLLIFSIPGLKNSWKERNQKATN